MSAKRDPKTGRYCKKEQPMTDAIDTTQENVRNYVVPVSSLFLWPIHACAWVFKTIVRIVILAIIFAVLIVVWDWYVGDPTVSCPAAPPALALVPGAFSI